MSSSSDPDGDTLQYRWDFESNGTWTSWSSESTITHTWNDDWSGNTALEASDGKLTSTDTATVTISNVNPVLDEIVVSHIDPVSVNTQIATNCTFTDVGLTDTYTYKWDWGDGKNSTGVISEANGAGMITGEHSYTDVGVYRVTLTVMDDDGGSSSVTTEKLCCHL